MPLQNRVDPFGNLFRTDARGTIMGNRGGVLHNGDREIVRSYKSRRWITCVLEFKDRRRIVMSERRYTELFFLDEATAFAAGLLLWTPERYTRRETRPKDATAWVLTPEPIVACIRNGYRLEIHESGRHSEERRPAG